jgi:hypothetical protein
MRTFTIRAGIAMVAALAATARAQDRALLGPSPREQFDAITAEFKQAQSDFNDAYRKATTDAEKKTVVDEKYPNAGSYAKRCRALAVEYPDDPVAVDSLVWAMQHGEVDDAMFPLLLRNVDNEKLADACRPLQSSIAQGADPFLRTLLDKSPHHEVRAQACYSLAKLCAANAVRARRLQDRSDEAGTAALEKRLGNGLAGKLRAADAGALEHESETLLEQVMAKFADVKYGRGTLGDIAKGDLFEVQNLSVGKQAPEIEGEDIDGVRFKLSDYRGQVVFLDFWGFW